MKQFWIFVTIIGLGISIVSSETSHDEPLRAIMRKFNRKLYRTVSRNERGNFVFSPFSLHMVLTLTYLGAPEDSATRKELEELLSYDGKAEDVYLKSYHSVFSSLLNNTIENKLQMELANRIYAAADLNIKDDFIKKIAQIQNTKIENIDFNDTKSATDLINNFVNSSTKGIIPNLFDEGDLDVLTRLVMVNAVYFKGSWQNPFDPDNTKPMEFHVDSRQSFTYPHGMNLVGSLRFAKIDELYDANILELPYSGNNYFMNIVMPNDSHSITDLDHFMGRFDTNKFEDRLFDQSYYSDVKVVLPRFDITFEWDELDKILEKLGVKTLFDAKRSNLTNISDDPLYVSKVVHKASISVNEEGSEAAATSGVALDTRSGIPNDVKEFIINKPFIFYIYDKENNLPLFFGRVVDPSGERKLMVINDDDDDDEDKNSINNVNNTFDFSGAKTSHLNNFKQNKEFEDQRWKEAFDINNQTQY